MRTGPTPSVLGRLPDPAALLAGYERDRASAFRFAGDADDFVAAHVLVRIVAADLLGTAPHRLTLTQCCGHCGGPHGRPSIVEEPGLAVSLSHTRGQVAAAAGAGPVGVDVERDRGERDRGGTDDLFATVLSPAELDLVRRHAQPGNTFAQLWVRKEALVKAGQATLDTLATIDLAADQDRWGGLCLTGWSGPGVVGACAAPHPAEVRPA